MTGRSGGHRPDDDPREARPASPPDHGVAATTADDTNRRRVIDLAMSRRPDMNVGELHQVLRRIGIRVVSDTVVADLDALGYRVEDGDRVALAMGQGSGRPGGPPDRPVDTARGKRRWVAWVVPVLVVVAVVAALVAAALAVMSLLDDGASEETGRGTVATGATPFSEGGELEGPAPASETPVGEPDVVLTFDGEGPLPPPGNLGPWAPGRGGWFVADGVARVGAPGEEEAVTYFSMRTPDVAAEVALPEASPGAGIAFRLLGADDYLAWTIAPDGRGVQLVRVEDAVQTVVLGPDDIDASVAPGVVLGVRADGPDLELLVDGEVVKTTTDDGPLDRAGVGLVAVGTDEIPVFDDLRATAL